MPKAKAQMLSAIISHEDELERTISQLIAESVARSDISVQGNPQQMQEKYGLGFLDPEEIKNKKNPPTHEAYLQDDFGWKLGFSFALPFIVCIIIGIFLIGDVRYTPDVWLYGILGAIIGALIGFFNAKRIKRKYDKELQLQEQQGGFVLWVSTHTPEQYERARTILEKHHSKF